jgi:hypothetical protein
MSDERKPTLEPTPEKMVELAEWLEAIEEVREGLESMKAGKEARAQEFLAGLRKEHGVLEKKELRELVAVITKDNRHGEIDCGPAMGNEAW